MSALLERPATAWQARPGWGIVVDLTPPQVVQARQVKVHQRLIGMGLALVIALCAGVGLLVGADRASAQRTYDEEQARTSSLVAQAEQYADITAMQQATARVQDDLATVMGDDVDVVNLMARVKQAVPAGVEISDLAVVLVPATPDAAAAPADPASGAATDATGATPDPAAPATTQVIGTLTVSGEASQVSAVTPFVSALDRLRGAVDVLPTSVVQSDDGGASYTITMNLTDVLHTDRYTQETTP